MAKPVILTLTERPEQTVEALRNGKYRIYVGITEKDEVINAHVDENEGGVSMPSPSPESTTQRVFLCEAVEVKSLDYATIVVAVVRSHYTADEVEAILCNGTDTKEHATELATFQSWRKKAKALAHSIVDGE